MGDKGDGHADPALERFQNAVLFCSELRVSLFLFDLIFNFKHGTTQNQTQNLKRKIIPVGFFILDRY